MRVTVERASAQHRSKDDHPAERAKVVLEWWMWSYPTKKKKMDNMIAGTTRIRRSRMVGIVVDIASSGTSSCSTTQFNAPITVVIVSYYHSAVPTW